MATHTLEEGIRRILSHLDPNLLEKARSLIPLQQLQLNAQRRFRENQALAQTSVVPNEEPSFFETLFIQELLTWFKNDFFSWYKVPECDRCKVPYIQGGASTVLVDPTIDTSEIYLCPRCHNSTYFHRYNVTNKLLDTRVGRCHEHAQTFALICKALKYDSRVVFDYFNDHIWNEIYSTLQKKWIHCDPAEGILNKPLMYERGWGKTLSYVIAIGDTGIQEVTWRYTTERSRRKSKARPDFEASLADVSKRFYEQIWEMVSATRKKELLLRAVCELTDFLGPAPAAEEDIYEGRLSGPISWRRERGEISKSAHIVGHTIKMRPSINRTFSLWYCCNMDKYLSMPSDGGNLDHFIYSGWSSLLYEYNNIKRKTENDWKMTYLAREESNEPGLLKWKFETVNGFVIKEVTILTNAFVCENGFVNCKIFTESQSLSILFKDTFQKQYWGRKLQPCDKIEIQIHLCGGSGPNAWQHAQIGRQSLNDKASVSFGIVFNLAKVKDEVLQTEINNQELLSET